jgi:polyhydroxyalkanoate synthesis regulator phasin
MQGSGMAKVAEPESMAVWRGMVIEALKRTAEDLDKKASQEALENLREVIQSLIQNCRYTREKCEEKLGRLTRATADKSDLCHLEETIEELASRADLEKLEARLQKLEEHHTKQKARRSVYRVITGAILTLVGFCIHLLVEWFKK